MKKILIVLIIFAAVLGAVYMLTKECKHEYSKEYEVIKSASCAEEGVHVKKCIRCGESAPEEKLEKLPHKTELVVLLEATCTGVGMGQEKCIECGAILKVEEIPIAAHVAGEDIIDKDATCISDGEKHSECVNCGKVLPTEVIKAFGHVSDNQNWETTKDATCIEEGQKELHCDVCDMVFKTDKIASLGHRVENWDWIIHETCTTDGEQIGVCTVCNLNCYQLIAAEGHHYTEWFVSPPDCWEQDCEIVIPTCTEDGFEYRHCPDCKTIESRVVKAFGHTAGEWKIDVEADCTTAGSKHQNCQVCDVVVSTEVIPAKGHTAGEWEIDVEANCTTSGSKHQDCQVCDVAVNMEVIPAQGHTAGEWIIDVEADCTTAGSKHQSCQVCDVVVSTEVIPAQGHTTGEWEIDVEANCTTAGSKHQSCRLCEVVINREVVFATGHSTEWGIVKDATCTEAGVQKQVCTVCDAVLKQSVIAILEHTAGEWSTTLEPTCYSTGMMEQRCSVCSKLLGSSTIPMIEHNYVEKTEQAIAPSCTEEGKRFYECTEQECHATMVKTVEKTEHVVLKNAEWTTVTAATCEKDGKRSANCNECEKVAKYEVIPATGHSMSEAIRANATCEQDGYIVNVCSSRGCNYTVTEDLPKLGHDYGNGVVQNNETLLYSCCRNGCDSSYEEAIPEIEILITVVRNEKASGSVDILYVNEYRVSAQGGYGELTYLVELYNGESLVETFPNTTDGAISFNYRVGKNETNLYQLVVTVTDELGNQNKTNFGLAENG